MTFAPSLFTRHVSISMALRGRSYRNRVRVMKQKPGFIEAYVFGTYRYTTSISRTEKHYKDACTCPYGATCKHTIALSYVIAENPQLLSLMEFEQKQAAPPQKTFLDILNAIIAPAPQPESLRRKKDQRVHYTLFTKEEHPWGEDKGKTLLGLEAGKAERSDPSQPYRLNDSQNIRSLLGRNSAYLTPIDRNILHLAANAYEISLNSSHWNAVPVEDTNARELIRRLGQAPLVFFHDGKARRPLTVIADPVTIQFQLESNDQKWRMRPTITVQGKQMTLTPQTVYDYSQPIIITSDKKLYLLETMLSGQQIRDIITAPPLPAAAMNSPAAITAILEASRAVPIIFPSSWKTQAVPTMPTPVVTIHANAEPWTISLAFSYDGTRVVPDAPSPLFARNDADHPIGERNRQKERDAITLLARFCGASPDPVFPLEIPALFRPQLFTGIIPCFPDDWQVYLQKENHQPLSRRPLSFSLQTTSATDWLDIEDSVTIDDQTISLHDLLDQALAADPIINLNGKYHMVSPSLQHALAALRPLKTVSGGGLRLHRTQIGLLDDLSNLIDQNALHDHWKRTIAAIKNIHGVKTAPLPKHLHSVLRPYQRHGVNFLALHRDLGFGAILADDMGLGKTIQAVAMLLIAHQAADNPSLIVCPTSVVGTWQQELARFAPKLRVLTYLGTTRVLPKTKTIDVIITTYPLLWRDINELETRQYHYVILDESQYIKNYGSQTAKAACRLRADHRLALTGTPMENNTQELFSQFAFLNPGLFDSIKGFKERFAVPIERRNDPAARMRLQKLIAPFLLRRKKEQVLTDLPPKIEQIRIMIMDSSQQNLYQAVKTHYQAKILHLVDTQGMERSHIQILEALLRLRQVCCDPTLLHFKERAGWLPARLQTTESVKRTEAMELLREAIAEGHSILLFSQFVQMLEILADACRREGMPIMMLTGRTQNRGSLVREFQTNGKPTVLLISLKAGGTGLTLTAADYVIHYDPWWNPAVETQATDRVHRIGQTKSVNVYKLIVKDSVEEKIQQLQEKKKGLIDNLITATSGPKRLTPEDLAFLFS